VKRSVLAAFCRAIVVLGCSSLLGGCHGAKAPEPASEAPPPAQVEHEGDTASVEVKHPEQFPMATATAHEGRPELSVTGVVSADVARAVPVVSLASGRVIEIRARLGDRVQAGQVLLRIRSADVSAAFADYQKARADQILALAQLDRAKVLYARGAIAGKDLEVAQDTADKAAVDVATNVERLHLFGADAGQSPTGIIDIVAPMTGVITEQNVTNAGGVKTLDNSPNLFTISDLSRVWILCDVYENDLSTVRLGDETDIHLSAYPDRVLTGRISNIAPILDPNLRTAKVRIEVSNPGLLRLGMFVSATFHGQTKERRTVVPATAVLHLHDRDWVYVPAAHGRFRRVEVVGGAMLPGNLQELRSGLEPGARVVANALVFQNTVEQ
jgi:cobalt-zinc-cadmium efflux system membrane fusion protein